jgi:hypothetical protein
MLFIFGDGTYLYMHMMDPYVGMEIVALYQVLEYIGSAQHSDSLVIAFQSEVLGCEPLKRLFAAVLEA